MRSVQHCAFTCNDVNPFIQIYNSYFLVPGSVAEQYFKRTF